MANCTTPKVTGVDSRHNSNNKPSTTRRNSYPSKFTLAIAAIILSLSYSSNNYYPLCIVKGLTLPSYESTLSFVRPRKVLSSPINTVGNTFSSSRLYTSSVNDDSSSIGTTADDSSSETVGLWKLFPKNKRKAATKTNTLVPYGPVPRGGSLSDIPSLPTTTTTSISISGGGGSTSTALQCIANVQGEGAAVLLQQPQRTIPGTRAIRVVKQVIVGTAMNINGIFTSSSTQSRGRTIRFSNGYSRRSTRAMSSTRSVNGSNSDRRLNMPNQQQRRINTNVSTNDNNNNSILRVGRSISLHRKRRRAIRSANNLASQSTAVVTKNSNKGKMRMETVDTLGLGNVNAWITNSLESSTILDDPTSIELVDLKSAAAVEKSSAVITVGESTVTDQERNQQTSIIPLVGRFFQQQQRTKDIEQQQHEIELGYTTASVKYCMPTSSQTISNDALSSIRGGSSAASVAVDSSASTTSSTSMEEEGVYIIETPLFPIILPRSFEPRTKVSSPSTTTSSTGDVEASVTSLEISVALPQVSTSTQEEEIKPSQQLLEAATQPLLPKNLLSSFTGRELYYPSSIESLVQTGIQMTLDETINQHVTWIGEKKTNTFLKEQGAVNGDTTSVMNSNDWYKALDTTQEVLVWSGKPTNKDGYGSELPIIKSISIINQSPIYLTKLLMDSSKVQIYNKMSLGRVDEKVFQTGVDTNNGKFGNDGETKIVRNLTKPPMVSSLLEFVTCMHARKLRSSDLKMLNPNKSDIDDEDTSDNTGYVVVSRAVTGGEWSNNAPSSTSPNGEKLVRNEILLGVNILKSIPGEPYKTEMTSVTHVYSPLIPLMLAKNAGVKGAIDFVRDIRALPTVEDEE